MFFLGFIFCVTNIIFGQNFFLLSINLSTTQYIYDFDTDLNKISLNISQDIPHFSFDNLLISTISVTEREIGEIEDEEELDGLKELYSLVEPPPENLGGDGLITIIRKETGERITVRYRNKDGSYNEDALKKINRISRCSLTSEERKIPIKLIEVIDRISDRFGKRPVILLSGYRTKPLNDITPGAAKKSLHLIGWAMDIRIDGISSKRVRDFARAKMFGGVGYYPRYGFVHIDIGKVRYWERYQYRKKTRYAYKNSKGILLSKRKSLNSNSTIEKTKKK